MPRQPFPPPNATGVTYTPDIVPAGDWPRDLSRIRENGLQLVRSGEFIWSWIEPAPGRFDTNPLERYLDAVAAAGLRLVLATPTATPPPWMDRVVPDARMRTVDGRPFLGFRQFVCRNHPDVLGRMQHCIETLAGTVKDHPALLAWQVDNEPHYGDGGGIASIHELLDFHPHAWEAFRLWLRQRVERPDDLDERWCARFWSQGLRDWDDLNPSLVVNNPHARLDWMRWRDANLAEHLHLQATWLRNITPHLPIGTNLPSCGPREQVLLGIDPVDQCRQLDWVGSDVYAADGDPERDLARLSALIDLHRGAAPTKPFLVAEAQAAPHIRAHHGGFAHQYFPPETLDEVWRRAAEHGATALWWFQWRAPSGGHERGMNGLTGVGGEATPHARRAAGLATRDMSACRRVFAQRPAVILALHRDSLRDLAWSPAQLKISEWGFLGWHRLLEAVGFRVEVREARHWEFDPNLPLVLPCAPLLAPSERRLLSERPGALFCGPATGTYDGDGHLAHVPDCPLLARMGISPGPWHDHPPPSPPAGWPALSHARDLQPGPNTQVLLCRADGTPALCQHQNTHSAGLCLGEAFHHGDERFREKLVRLASTWLTP